MQLAGQRQGASVLVDRRACDILQVRFSSHQGGNGKSPPTAVMVHGILGNRRNMHAFAKRLSEVSSSCCTACAYALVSFLLGRSHPQET